MPVLLPDKYLPPLCTEHVARRQPGCPTCRAYVAAAKRRARRMRRLGMPRFGDVPTVAAHIRALLDAGYSQRRLAALCGVDVTIIRRVLGGRQHKIFAGTAQRLLAVSVPSQAIAQVGVVRRCQALTAAGFSAAQIGAAVGVSADAIQCWREGRRPPKKMWAEKLIAAYAQMWEQSGDSVRSLQLARRRGWLLPEAWDEVTIDDPDAVPYQHIDHGYVDDVKVKRALAHEVPFCDLTPPERVEMIRLWLDQTGWSLRTFQDTFRPEKDAGWTLRRRWLVEAARELGIEHKFGGRDG